MNPAFAPDYGTSFSDRQLKHNHDFENGFPIANAVRSQFSYDRQEILHEENLAINMKVIDGRGR